MTPLSPAGAARGALLLFAACAATGYVMSRVIAPGQTYLFSFHGLVASTLLLALVDRSVDFSTRPEDRAPVILAGLATALVPYLILEGSRLVTPALASIIVISNALMIALASYILGRKRFTPLQTLALVTGFFGVVWISYELGSVAGKFAGALYLLAASALIAGSTLLMEKVVQRIGGVAGTKRLMAATLPMALVVLIISGSGWFHSTAQSLLGLLFGIVSLGAPVLFFNLGMARVGAADAASFKLLIPLFAFLYAIILFGEKPDPQAGLAGLVIVGSVALYQRAGRA